MTGNGNFVKLSSKKIREITSSLAVLWHLRPLWGRAASQAGGGLAGGRLAGAQAGRAAGHRAALGTGSVTFPFGSLTREKLWRKKTRRGEKQ